MEKLTKKEKQERLQKAKKVAHNVMHIVGYVSLGLLGLILCLTASKCSKTKTLNDVQVQEVVRPYEKPQGKIDNSITEYDIKGIGNTTNLTHASYRGTNAVGTFTYLSGGMTYSFDTIFLDFDGALLTFEVDSNDQMAFFETFDLSQVVTYGKLSFTTAPANFLSDTFVQNLITNGVLVDLSTPVTPVVDNNEVIVSLGEAWTDTITSFAGVLASSVNSIVAIFYANNSLTFVGILLCIAMGVGVVYFAFRLIRNLIRNRG